MRFATMCKSTLTALLLIALGACGGGSSGNSDAPAPFTFAKAGPVDLYVQDTYSNTASGAGADGVSYVSSDTAIATVDGATGLVTAVRVGTAVITANKLVNVPNSTSQVVAGNATYTVNIQQSGPAFSARFLHQVAVFNNELWMIDGKDLNGIKNDTWSSSDGITWVQRAAANPFSARFTYGLTAFNNRLWVIGGSDASEDKDDVWSSADGLTWTEETAHAGFPVREYSQVVAFNNRLWLIGGQTVDLNTGTATQLNDVWSSTDGITWIQKTATADFPARHNHQVVVYNNQMFVIGGVVSDGTLKNDVWSSSDGVTWTQQTASAPFSARELPQVVVNNNQLWLVGGLSATSNLNDVWSSSDGINWTEQTTHAAFAPRNSDQVVAFNGQLILVGGYDGDAYNDVWSSTDGINWLVVYKGAFRAP